MSDINIVFASDKNYSNFLATAIASILTNSNNEDNLKFYVLDGGISMTDRDKILTLKSIKNFSIHFIPMRFPEELRKYYIQSHYNMATYLRFFIANTLNELDKVLYLDVDIIVLSSLSELYEIELGNAYVAACPDLAIGIHKAISRLDIYGHNYFNAGVLLINLQKWREDNMAEQLVTLNYNIQDKLCFLDQDVLNVLFYKNYIKIGQEWNCSAEYALTLPNVKIIHFMGNMKFNYTSSYLLHEYIALTPFKSFKVNRFKLPSKQNMLVLVKRLIRKLVSQKQLGNALAKLAAYIIYEREKIAVKTDSKAYKTNEQLFIDGAIQAYSPDLKVLHGVFKGLQYPKTLSNSVNLFPQFPKLLGSYEQELSEVLQDIIAANPQTVINIGCAEGYYAVGLAITCPNATVYAFDSDVEAQRACTELAKVNKVTERLTVGGECSEQVLLDLPAMPNTGKGVFIYTGKSTDNKVLSSKVFTHFRNFSFILRIQDCFDIGFSTYIRHITQTTHDIIPVNPCSDTVKAINCSYEELMAYGLHGKKILLAENKPDSMSWFYLVPKEQ